jgi:Fe-S-cluster containining protein
MGSDWWAKFSRTYAREWFLLVTGARILGGMGLPSGDSQLVQIMDAALKDAAERAGPWLACRPGCTQCCHGAFAINALDVERLRVGIDALRVVEPERAEAIEARAQAWIAEFGKGFPGDVRTGVLGESDEEQARFEDFANDAPCPALNPETGLCDVYEWRPMTCRVFGPPVSFPTDEDLSVGTPEIHPTDEGLSAGTSAIGGAVALACCELCFVGASEPEIAACEMAVPHELEARLVEETGRSGETVVAFALLR